MKKCIHSIHDADCPHCLRDLYDMARHRIAALEARCRAVEEEYAEYRACEKPEAEAAEKHIAQLEAALRDLYELVRKQGMDTAFRARIMQLIYDLPAETVCKPGPITQEPQDYKVQCRCGWMGQVSTLKSLPEFKMGCPVCSQEFMPIDKMTFPVNRTVKP